MRLSGNEKGVKDDGQRARCMPHRFGGALHSRALSRARQNCGVLWVCGTKLRLPSARERLSARARCSLLGHRAAPLHIDGAARSYTKYGS
jgi:hypothetical protein